MDVALCDSLLASNLIGGDEMISSKELWDHVLGCFDPEKVAKFPEEMGLLDYCETGVDTVGYCANLTPDTIEVAHGAGCQLILTHHDAWDFIFGLKDECINRLKEYGMAAGYVHGLLDDADFGTSATLLRLMGARETGKCCPYMDLLMAGRFGTFDDPIDFSELQKRLEEVCGERVKSWEFHNRPVRMIAVITGAGMMTQDMRAAFSSGCDVYITGEKILYSVMYAKLMKVNMLVGSHTFTETHGVRSLTNELTKILPDLRFVEIPEEHLE
jgi:putative NIF3 family GTP cyclohydrolase 1 type 2